MNTPSPLVPQGTSPDRGKSSLYFKILMIVSLHVVVFGGVLLQGCKDTKSNNNTDTTTTSDQSNTDIGSLPPVNTNIAPPLPGPSTSSYAATPTPAYAPGTNPAMNTAAPLPGPTPVPTPVPEASAGTEYVVARGDTLALIAKKNGVSLKALEAANTGINPRKLKIGAKLEIPSGGTGGVAATGGATDTGAGLDSGDTSVYVVKAGDMLGRIAKSHGTTVGKIKALNDLKTTSIKVGQKLKLPAPKMAAEPAPTPAPVMTPAPTPSALPPSYATTSQPAGTTH